MADGTENLATEGVAMASSQAPARSRFALRSPREALQPVAAPAPPPRRRRKGGFLGKISGILSLMVFLSVVIGGAAIYVTTEINAPGPLAADKVVLIPKNSSGGEIVEQLNREGIIAHPSLASGWIIWKQPKLRAGEFLFKKGMSIASAISLLDNGKPITYRVTIPEGLTSEQIVERLIENDVLDGEIRDIPREGSLLPDTYTFERGFSREQMLKLMRNAQDKLVKEIWSRRSPDIPLRSPLELVVLASIVEKETGKAEERQRVAAVFVNRLNRDMRLQTDPTVIYGIVGGRGSLGRGLTRAELDTPTPYNTYTIKGLPPGPIANPGRAALEAVANPLKSNEIFFVADGTGGHAFAESRAQHERNVARWRQIESQPRDVPREVSPSQSSPPNTRSLAPQGIPVPQGLNPQSPVPPGTRSALPVPNVPRLATAPPALPNSPFNLAPLPVVTIPGIGTTGVADEALESAGIAPENFVDTDAGGGRVESFPVPASRRTGNRSALAAAGLDAPNEGARNAAPALSREPRVGEPATSRLRAFDAVEGTAKDPLRNTTYDLNFPKTIPNLK